MPAVQSGIRPETRSVLHPINTTVRQEIGQVVDRRKRRSSAIVALHNTVRQYVAIMGEEAMGLDECLAVFAPLTCLHLIDIVIRHESLEIGEGPAGERGLSLRRQTTDKFNSELPLKDVFVNQPFILYGMLLSPATRRECRC